jgi:hypothetical protein
MRFDKGKIKDYYLFTTDVENVFINEYMTEAPGDYVKAYLYGLFCSEHGMALKSALMAEVLRMDEDRLREAWEYWERMNVVEIREDEDDYTVIFLNLREQLYSGEQAALKAASKPAEKEEADVIGSGSEGDFRKLTEAAEDMLGRPLNGKELQEIGSWTKDLGVTDEVIYEAFDYCTEILARGLANIYWNFDPDVVVVGGSIDAHHPVYLQTALKKAERYLPAPDSLHIEKARFGDDAGLVGAALLVG